MNPLSAPTYDQLRQQQRRLATRMRSGTGVSGLIRGENSVTHHIDELDRFQKDFALYDKRRRELELQKRQMEIEKKRVEGLQRQNKRWQVVQENQQLQKQKMNIYKTEVQQGRRKTANSNSLAYNPISLVYHTNPQGQRLKHNDQDNRIRGLVRAYNMDHHGNSPYNPLNGEDRRGVNAIVPGELNERYQERLRDFEESRRIRVPQSQNQVRSKIFWYH